MIELAVSAAVLSILLITIGSAIVIASKAIPGGDTPVDATVEAGNALARLTEELQYALLVTERGANAVTFTLPDRDGDGKPQVVRYAWSGTAGDPLTRQANGATPVTLIEDVRQFDLAYDTKDQTQQYPGPDIVGPEQLLASFDPAGGPADSKDYKIDKDKWPGQYFKPTLPANALSWHITRVRFRGMQGAGNIEDIGVQIQPADASKLPTGTILEEVVISEATLQASYNWVEVLFSDVTNLAPGAGMCLVLENDLQTGVAGNAEYDDKANLNGGTGLLNVNSNGSASYESARSLLYYVYGKVSTPGVPQSVTRTYFTGVRAALRAGDDADSRVDSNVALLNTPEYLGKRWEADFSADPTALDLNADGVNDWAVTGGGNFNTGSLSAGVWIADTGIEVAASDDFQKVTTVDMRIRDSGVGNAGPGFKIHVDHTGADLGIVYTNLQKQSGGTQVFEVYHYLDASTTQKLGTITGLPAGFLDVQLLFDPAVDTVAVFINDKHYVTYTYARFSYAAGQYAGFFPWQSNSEFDSVCIRRAP